jgi:hypothetical protein
MLRSIYFFCALLFAAVVVISTLAGFVYVMYQLTVIGRTLDEAMTHGTAFGMLVSGLGIVGWILFSYLFVVEDERLENSSGTNNHP